MLCLNSLDSESTSWLWIHNSEDLHFLWQHKCYFHHSKSFPTLQNQAYRDHKSCYQGQCSKRKNWVDIYSHWWSTHWYFHWATGWTQDDLSHWWNGHAFHFIRFLVLLDVFMHFVFSTFQLYRNSSSLLPCFQKSWKLQKQIFCFLYIKKSTILHFLLPKEYTLHVFIFLMINQHDFFFSISRLRIILLLSSKMVL